MTSPSDISGDVVVVTRSSRGIGRAVAEHLAAAGVRDAEALQDAVVAVGSHFGRLDGVVANVGGAAR